MINYYDCVSHYERLIDENNDPVHDPEQLRDYMDKWDGDAFIDALGLSHQLAVLEVGVGTGRLAVKVAPHCREFHGIDISPKTIERAIINMISYENINLICDNFMTHYFERTFDVIYSSLTFMHIKDKRGAIKKIKELMNMGGLFVLSISKSQDNLLIFEDRTIEIYPDTVEQITQLLFEVDLLTIKCFETEFAVVFVARN